MTPRLVYSVFVALFLFATVTAIYGLCQTPTDARWVFGALVVFCVQMVWIFARGAHKGEW
jgi:hypothetical protein